EPELLETQSENEEDCCDTPLAEALHSILGNTVSNLKSLASEGVENIELDDLADVVKSALDDLFARLACDDALGFDPFDHLS
ncbi:MAG TPA: hypothetical protein VFV87_07870, partial [Pirellulaceae bacterium]|nr:hypothetical protein [Pirellulaceae bacterium]